MLKNRGKVDFGRLIYSDEFAKFSRLLEGFTGLCVTFCSPGSGKIEPLTELGRLSPLCNLIQATPEGRRRCRHTLRSNSRKAAQAGTPMVYPCHADLYDISMPVFSEGKWVGSIQSGQLLPAPPSEEGLRKFMEQNADLFLDPAAVREAYFKAPYQTKEMIETFMGLLSLFAGYVCEMGRRIHVLTEARQSNEIDRAKQYIHDHFREPISQADVAEHAGFCPTWLSRQFKKIAGITFVEYVQQMRIEEVKKLLSETDKSITTIALESGFNSFSQFHRVFRKFEKTTPSQYRERLASPQRRTNHPVSGTH